MRKLRVFYLMVIMCLITQCWCDQENICLSFREEGVVSNASNDSALNILLQHDFLQVENGIVPGLRYNVSLRQVNEGDLYFALNSEPLGFFEKVPSGVSYCDEHSQIIAGRSKNALTLSFTAPNFINGSLAFFLSTRLASSKQWTTVVKEYNVRSDCYYIATSKDAVLSSEDVEIETSRSILIHSPATSGLQITLENVLIPEGAMMLIYNTSESSTAFELVEEDQMTFSIRENRFFLIDITRCFDCRFRALIKPIALSYECNTTIRTPRGSLELKTSLNVCSLLFEAPLYHRVLLKIQTSRSPLAFLERCQFSKLALSPLAGVPRKKTWPSCESLSRAQTEFYISESDLLQVDWEGSASGILLNYEYFPLCANRSLGETSSGHFCSPGYPNLYFGCNTSYAITVPFGYSIELQLSVLGGTTGAFCQNNSLEVTTKNSTHGEKPLLTLCLDTPEARTDSFSVVTNNNLMAVRMQPKADLVQKGFCASYKAIPKEQTLTEDCPYGWVAGVKFCYKVFDQETSWKKAEGICQQKGGHLASVTDNRIALLIDMILKHSPLQESNNAFWIGANDLRYENCFEWSDGQPFDFDFWFPGWENYGWYSIQPSDDGLSQQNCVEIRNLFRYPSKGEGVTDRYFWNDRDCYVNNPFICQRLKPGVNVPRVSVPVCNRTTLLSWEHSREVLTSPGFPSNYPNNVKCHYHIAASPGKRIVLFFTDFVLEESDSCEYDLLTLLEEGVLQWRHCGDWESKIKLLRYISTGTSVDLFFETDFSHAFKGFRLEASLLADDSGAIGLCDNDMFQLQGDQCYLVVNYPEASWTTARQICAEARSILAVLHRPEQAAVLEQVVRATYSYIAGSIYWVGASAPARNDSWKWVDGTPLDPKELRLSRPEESWSPSCLAVQWKQLRNSNALKWVAKNCNHPGRFICKKPAVAVPEELNKTVSEMKGNLTSANYPSNYLNNLDYVTEIIGPSNSRVVVTFYHFDVEWQEDCLYDYVLLRSDLKDKGVKLCGELSEDREFVSSGNKEYISFHSDFSVTSSGYSASWEVVDLSVCVDRRLLVLEPTPITSVRYPQPYLNDVECRLTVIASEATKRLLLTVVDFQLGHCTEAYLEINLDPSDSPKTVRLCGSDLLPGTQLLAYGHEAQIFFHANAAEHTKNRGYNLTCQTWGEGTLESTLSLNSQRKGRIYSLNLSQAPPMGVNYSQRIVAPFGYKIFLRTPNISGLLTSGSISSCEGSGLDLIDPYGATKTRRLWNPCISKPTFEGIWSTLNVFYIHGWNFDGNLPSFFFEYAVLKDDHFLNTTLALASDSIESCRPSPCLHGGRCVRNGTVNRCHCYGQYTGLFCHLTWCEMNVCGENGVCNLTSSGWSCECLPGFTGKKCQQPTTPCTPDPCTPNGLCTVRNATFECICAPDYEGTHCEKFVIRIPYKPLSQRMLEEPFWLGLITVFSVLLIILFVYCIKRKFADKIEKFLAEEIERSKYQPSPPATRYSLSSTQPNLTPGTQSPQTGPKFLFNRIRKNSLLSATCSPSPTAEREQSRTFSFDDILRRVHSSKRNRSPSKNPDYSVPSTSSGHSDTTREDAAKKEEEKSRILASLVTSNKEAASRRMSLDEFFRMSERKLKLNAKRTNSTAESTESEDAKKETSFMSLPSAKTLRQSFSEIHSIQEQSIEYMSSSESLNCEPSTSEIQADVSPHPPFYKSDSKSQDEDSIQRSPESPIVSLHSGNPSPTPTEHSIAPAISITVDPCDSEAKPDSEPDEKNCDKEVKEDCESLRPLSPAISRKSSYLEVPHPIPAIHVCSVEANEPQDACESANCSPKPERSDHTSPCKKDFVQPRKYSVDLPMPKILITANMSSCDSDEASPPRTPNPNKSMMYLSPLAVISSSTDRTISESNLSTSGYSSISSPGLSRCNSSSPISDDVEHHHHPNCNRKNEPQSPKKPHGLQMTYLSVGGHDKTFFFPPTIACHCHTPNQSAPVLFEQKNTAALPTVWTPGKHRLLYKRNSYQTTSTDDSIDDEGIGMDTIDFKIRKGDVRSARDLEVYITADASPQVVSSSPFIESGKPDLLTCSVNKQPSNVAAFKGSPRTANRKSEKPKKYSDKHRRSPILSPASTPVKDHSDSSDTRIPRNSSRTSMSGTFVSSSESDDPEGYLGIRQKNQSRRSKKHEVAGAGHKQPLISMPSQDSSGTKTDKSSDATGRSSPQSESNGDSAPMDSRSPVSSSSESLPSTRDSKVADKPFCSRHKFPLEHAQSFPPPNQESKLYKDGNFSKLELPKTIKHPPIIQVDSDDEALSKSSEEHPCLRRQEAVIEDEPSDDSSSETTVLLRRPAQDTLQPSSSADVSEWEAFTKE